jgi:hypothetical protein
VDGTFAPLDLWADRQNVLIGQYKYISGRIGAFSGVVPGDEITSVVTGATSRWKVFYDGLWIFALLIEGAPPGNLAVSPNYNYATAANVNQGSLTGIVNTVLTAAGGWAGIPAWLPGPVSAAWQGTGESGTDDIQICLAWDFIGANGYFYLGARGGGNQTTAVWGQYNGAWWPFGNVYAAGDRDGVCFTLTDPFNRECLYWMGKPQLLNGIPGGNYYNIGCFASMFANQCRVLHNHETGAWDIQGNVARPNGIGLNSNANAYDATTYPVWPYILSHGMTGAGAMYQPLGWMQYAMYTDGGGIARFDTITAGPEQYTVFNCQWLGGAAEFWSMRNV